MILKRGIDKAVEAVVAELDKIARPVKDTKEIAQVGIISANGDVEIGEMIAHAMDKVGWDGVITVDEAKGTETVLEVVEGMQIDPRLPFALLRDQFRQDELRNGGALYSVA